MFKIEATRQCKQSTVVELNVFTDLNVERARIPFAFDTRYQYSAELLCQYLNTKISELLTDKYTKGFDMGKEVGIRIAKQQAKKQTKKKR